MTEPVLPTDTLANVPSDLSPRVVDLAREIDRLPPGQSIIIINKDWTRAKEWEVEILAVQHSRSMTLPKRRSSSKT